MNLSHVCECVFARFLMTLLANAYCAQGRATRRATKRHQGSKVALDMTTSIVLIALQMGRLAKKENR